MEAASDADVQLLVDFQERLARLLGLETARIREEHTWRPATSSFTAPLTDLDAGVLERDSNGKFDLDASRRR